MNKQELEATLAHFCGSLSWFRHPLTSRFIWSEGVDFLIEEAKCWWLVNDIFIHLTVGKEIRQQPEHVQMFHFWELIVENNAATLTAYEDLGINPFIEKEYDYTDFPLDEIKFYAGKDSPEGPYKLFLPSEY